MAKGDVPHHFDRYEIKSELRRGGQSTVYIAFDPRFNRDVAIKLLPAEFLHDPTFLERFKREAQTLAKLEHSAIVPVYDFGSWQGQSYLVMRLMSGGNLAERISRRSLSPQEAAEILSRIAPALDKAHAMGIIHRDIKPGNILFDQEGKAYLSDFGTVKFAESAATVITVTGTTLGTPAYMSPEQARATEAIDGRSDIYSLGIVLYEMLTGLLPYKADTPMGLAMMHVMEPVPRILSAKGDLDPRFEPIIAKALAKDRNARYQKATALAMAVNSVAYDQDSDPTMVMKTEFAPPDFVFEQKTKISTKRKIPAWAVTGAAVAIIAVVALIALFAAGVLGGGEDTQSASAGETPQSSQPLVIEVTRLVTEEVISEVTRLVEQNPTEPAPPTPAPETASQEQTRQLTGAALGGVQRPVQLLFPPRSGFVPEDTSPYIQGLTRALEQATGLNFDFITDISYEDTIEALCDSPKETLAFVGAGAYVLASQRCGASAAAAAIRFRQSWSNAQIVIRSDSDIDSLEDLNGLTWGIPGNRSVIGYVYPLFLLRDKGVEPGERVDTGNNTDAMAAIYNREVDFATAFFSAPVLPYNDRQWQFGQDDPEIWREGDVNTAASSDGIILIDGGPNEGGYIVYDARRGLIDVAPDILEKTRILAITDPIPRDTLVFGPDFPPDLAKEIVQFLVDWVDPDISTCLSSVCNPDYLAWEGMEEKDESHFAYIRDLIERQIISVEEIFDYGL